MNELQAGREAMKQRCIECALKNTPPNVRVIIIRKNLTGRATYHRGEMSAPRPFTRKSLYIFLHECAHFVLHDVAFSSRKPRHVEEMEAEKWAHEKMREAGIPVPRAMTRRAKAYVARKIHQAERRGAKSINSEARRYARSTR